MDGGTDMKGKVGEIFNWECGVRHVLSRMEVDGNGSAMDKKRCKHPRARQLVDDARRIFEHFNKCDAAEVRLLGVRVQAVETSCSRRDNAVTCPKSEDHEHFDGPLSLHSIRLAASCFQYFISLGTPPHQLILRETMEASPGQW